MFLVYFRCEILLDGESGYMHLRKLALTLPKLCHKTQGVKLHPVNTIMKSFMAFILDQILGLLFMEKNSQIYCAYMTQVAKLFQ